MLSLCFIYETMAVVVHRNASEWKGTEDFLRTCSSFEIRLLAIVFELVLNDLWYEIRRNDETNLLLLW